MWNDWLNPVAIMIVLGGTLLATTLRCGFAEMRGAIMAFAGLFGRHFDVVTAKAEVAAQIRDIADDGFLRAEVHHFSDDEFDCLAGVLVSSRSLEALREEHEKYKQRRLDAATKASHVFDQAVELAPVLGLAGTLIALGSGTQETVATVGFAGAIAMAVVTTLYGLLFAHLLFAPISAAIERRAAAEEIDRQEVLDWLENAVRKACRPSEIDMREAS